MWVCDIFKERKTNDAYNNVVREMCLGDREFYFKYMRMSPDWFDHLLSLIDPIVTQVQHLLTYIGWQTVIHNIMLPGNR